jgi:hypothetical protein
MKWPVVLFILILGITVFETSSRHVLTKTVAIVILGLGVYLLVSVMLLRLVPADGGQLPTNTATTAVPRAAPVTVSPAYATRAIETGAASIPQLAIAAINRMAIAVPYYYEFAAAHPECAQATARLWIKRKLSCEPTLLVYSAMFGDDGFAGVGTAPAAVHLYGYALDGWPGALISLGLASIVVGLFVALWPAAQGNSMVAASFVMGTYAAYHFSQLPIEGPLIYDHGVWWAFLVLGWMAIYWSWRWFSAGVQFART